MILERAEDGSLGKRPNKNGLTDGRIHALCGVLVVALGCPWAGIAADTAREALAREDYGSAFRQFAEHAQAGDPIAQNNLGVLYLQGRGVPKDLGAARVWFERAAAQKLPGAMHNLGILYLRGYGVSKDPALGARWLTQAAESGDREAQFFIGLLYYKGEGVAPDLAQARAWFTRAADQHLPAAVYNLAVMQLQGQGGARDEAQAITYLERHQSANERIAVLLGQVYLQHASDPSQAARALSIFKPLADAGNPSAQSELGMMYTFGRGAARDLEEGRFWLQQAARLGAASAQLNLGNVYANGLGVARDRVEAYAWYSLAAANGDPVAARNLNLLNPKLKADERARATTRAAALRELHKTAVNEPAAMNE